MKMIKLTATAMVSLALALSITACDKQPIAPSDQGSQANENTTLTGKIQYSLKNDGRQWKVVNKDDAQDQIKVVQYILVDEEPENVSELFTVTEMTDVNITPSEYFSQFITELQKRYANAKVESKIINQKTNSLFGEWWIDGVSPDNTQHEWIRIIKKGNDIAVLRYSTMKVDQLEKNRNTWESILNDAKFQ